MAATGLTSNFNLSYPLTSDTISLASDIQNLATDVDTELTGMVPKSGGTMTGALEVSNVTDSSSSVTGAVKTSGGLGVAKSLYVGANVNVTGTLTLASKVITLGGNLTTSGAYNLTATLTGATNVTLPTTGTLATLAGSEILSNKTLTTPNIGAATGTSVALTGVISTDSTTNATSTTTGSIQTDGGIGVAKDVYVGGSVIAVNTPGRNLLHNGAMQVHQRGTSVAGITTPAYQTADRWHIYVDGLGTWTNTVEDDAPTGSGFRKSLKVLCTTADATPAANDGFAVIQYIEGQNAQSIKKGTTSAEPLTLSFWAKSNKTGTYIVRLADPTNSRHVAASYTIAASGTWEPQTLTFPADLTGALLNDNSTRLQVEFRLGAGSNSTSGTLATTWATATLANSAVGQTNLAASTNNYFQITGVQLEVGSAATGFEFKGYGNELTECQRYYWRWYSGGADIAFSAGVCYANNSVIGTLTLPVPMRDTPTGAVENATTVDVVVGGAVVAAGNTLALSNPSATTVQTSVTNSGTPFTVGHGALIRADSGFAYSLSADL